VMVSLVKKVRKKLRNALNLQDVASPVSLDELSLSQLTKLLGVIPYFEDKINLVKLYQLDFSGMYGLKKEQAVKSKLEKLLAKNNLDDSDLAIVLMGIDKHINAKTSAVSDKSHRFDNVHFACGGNYFDDWLNVDFAHIEQDNYLRLNLCERLPFSDGHFKFGFAEDFLEHLGQDDSLTFLAEVHRCMQAGGVLRLSFPGLEGVLRKHYLKNENNLPSYDVKLDAYLYWGHLHFYSKDELTTVANHIGYNKVEFVEFVEFGQSIHKELCGLDTREHQKDLNTYAELTK